jgi:glycosyltransferase involved in cell wall biosynthesis
LPITNVEISIIIAARNMERYIRDTLASVVADTYPTREIIVVDDGSTDRTAAIAAEFNDPRVQVIVRRQDHGVSAARNAGMAVARGRAVLCLDADDVLVPGALQRLLAALDDNPKSVAAYGAYLPISETGQQLASAPSRISIFPPRDTLRHLLAKNFIVTGGTLLMRTDAARSAGQFETDITFGEDWDLWCRLALRGDFVPVHGEPVLYYRQRSGGANQAKRGTPLQMNDAAIQRAYGRHEIQSRFTPKELADLERLVRIDTYWAGVRNELAFGSTARFLGYAVIGVVKYPDSILRPKLALRFLASLARARRPT